jgi:hypothetical protein
MIGILPVFGSHCAAKPAGTARIFSGSDAGGALRPATDRSPCRQNGAAKRRRANPKDAAHPIAGTALAFA